jgi:hypothetical protein
MNLSDKFFNNSISNDSKSLYEEYESFEYLTKLFFFTTLHERINEINPSIYNNLRNMLDNSNSQNAEILHSWIMLSLKLRRKDIIPLVDSFLSMHGRYDFLINLYKEYYILDKFSAMKSFNSFK